MSDLTEKLEYYDSITKQEAVDRIEELEAALKGIAARRHCFSDINGCGAASTARAALQENEL